MNKVKRFHFRKAHVDGVDKLLFEIKPYHSLRWLIKFKKKISEHLHQVVFFTRNPNLESIRTSIDFGNVYELSNEPMYTVLLYQDAQFFHTEVENVGGSEEVLRLKKSDKLASVIDSELPF